MGVLDPIDAPPVVKELNKDSAGTATPAATPEPKIPENAKAPPEDKPSNVVNFPAPKESASNTESALRAIGNLERERSTMMPPKLQMPEKPKTAKDDIQLWGALAIAFAALASGRTRQPMTTALNAAAAALNGMHDGQKERADQAYKEWEQQSKIALETADYEQRAYQDLMQNINRREALVLQAGEKLDQEQIRKDELHFKVLTEALQDAPMAKAYEDGVASGGQAEGLKRAAGLYDQREKAKQKLEESKPGVVQAKMMADAYDALQNSKEWKDSEGDPSKRMQLIVDLEGKLKASGSKVTPWSPEEIHKQAERVVNGDMAPPSSSNLTGRYASPNAIALWDAVTDLAKERGFEYKEADYNAYRKLDADLVGKAGDQIRAFTVLTHHLAFLDELGKQLQGQTDSQAINRITNAVARQFGMPEITNFDLVKTFVGDETVKAILGSGVGGVTDRAEAEKYVAPFQSPEQLQGATASIRRLAQGQLAGRLEEYRKFIDRGWIKAEDIIPIKTMQELGFTKTDSKALLDIGTQLDPQKVNLEGTGVSIPKPGIDTPKEEVPPPGMTHRRPLKDGGFAYSTSEDGPWFDAQGKPLGK